MWGVGMPVAGAIADRTGHRPVMLAGILLVAAATAAAPLAHSTAALVVLIGILGALGSAAMGPGLLMSAVARWIPDAKRNIATGIINAGGSFGQFTVIPLAQLFIGLAGWQPAMVLLGGLWIGRVITGRRMKLALAWIYFARAAMIVIFFFAPKTTLTFLLFAAGIGFSYLSTVPPTVGRVVKFYGVRYMATLFGVVMLSHQVGGFLG